MIVGCYSVDLYCDNEKCPFIDMANPDVFTGETETQCLGDARRAGWQITRGKPHERKAYCPKCSTKKRKNTK